MSGGYFDGVGDLASRLSEKFDDGVWWGRQINSFINSPIQKLVRPPYSATNVLQKEWDVLIVLDACRADLFEETDVLSSVSELEQTTVMSKASATPEWLQRTFGDSHGEIVYIAGNPMVTRHCSGSFHKLIESWRTAYDSDSSIISPKQITEDALDARSNHPNKRLIVHYMQPHYPFIDHPELNYADYSFSDVQLDPQDKDSDIRSVWDALAYGLVEEEMVWNGYKHNLEIVLEEVRDLMESIDDRIVLTSDHGNLMGERSWPIPVRTSGHFGHLRNKSLIRVPWVVRRGERRQIIEGEVSSSSAAAGEEVKDRLSNLGYID